MSISISNGNESVQASPNVVPLCDVLLVLLIIFMVVTPLISRGVELKLPAAVNTASMGENLDVVLYVRKDGTLVLNNDKVTLETLQSKLEEAYLEIQEKSQDKKLYLKADGDVEYGKLIYVYEKIREAGIESIALITDRKTEKG